LPSGDANITEALKRATQIVDAAKVPADLRSAAFDRVLSQILSGKTPPPDSSASAGVPTTADAGVAQTLASKLGVSDELAAEVYQPKADGTLSVHVPTARLAKAKSAATKELALLVMAGRQASQEEWTDSDDIISVLQHYGKFDSPNNSSIMKEGENHWLVSGGGKKRKFKLRKVGWEAAGDLVMKLAAR
jgi:hypothetical protein